MVVRKVAVGENVPPDLRNEPGLTFTAALESGNTWEKTWLNLGLWDRNWGENTSQTPAISPVRTVSFGRRWDLESVLSPEELEVVERLNLEP